MISFADRPSKGRQVHIKVWTTHSWDLSGRGTTRAEDAQGTPAQSHISPNVLVYEDNVRNGSNGMPRYQPVQACSIPGTCFSEDDFNNYFYIKRRGKICRLQGYLTHNSYCRVLGGRCFVCARYPCTAGSTSPNSE